MNEEVKLDDIIALIKRYKEQENERCVETQYPFEEGDWLYYIDDLGIIQTDQWSGDCFDEYRYSTSNVFSTKKEAERKLEIQQYLFKHCYNFTNEDWSSCDIKKYFMIVDRVTKNVYTDWVFVTAYGVQHFKTREEARAAAKFIGYDDYIKYVLNERG